MQDFCSPFAYALDTIVGNEKKYLLTVTLLFLSNVQTVARFELAKLQATASRRNFLRHGETLLHQESLRTAPKISHKNSNYPSSPALVGLRTHLCAMGSYAGVQMSVCSCIIESACVCVLLLSWSVYLGQPSGELPRPWRSGQLAITAGSQSQTHTHTHTEGSAEPPGNICIATAQSKYPALPPDPSLPSLELKK